MNFMFEWQEQYLVFATDNVQGHWKYPSIFSPQMEAVVFIIPQIFFAMRTVLKIGEY